MNGGALSDKTQGKLNCRLFSIKDRNHIISNVSSVISSVKTAGKDSEIKKTLAVFDKIPTNAIEAKEYITEKLDKMYAEHANYKITEIELNYKIEQAEAMKDTALSEKLKSERDEIVGKGEKLQNTIDMVIRVCKNDSSKNTNDLKEPHGTPVDVKDNKSGNHNHQNNKKDEPKTPFEALWRAKWKAEHKDEYNKENNNNEKSPDKIAWENTWVGKWERVSNDCDTLGEFIYRVIYIKNHPDEYNEQNNEQHEIEKNAGQNYKGTTDYISETTANIQMTEAVIQAEKEDPFWIKPTYSTTDNINAGSFVSDIHDIHLCCHFEKTSDENASKEQMLNGKLVVDQALTNNNKAMDKCIICPINPDANVLTINNLDDLNKIDIFNAMTDRTFYNVMNTVDLDERGVASETAKELQRNIKMDENKLAIKYDIIHITPLAAELMKAHGITLGDNSFNKFAETSDGYIGILNEDKALDKSSAIEINSVNEYNNALKASNIQYEKNNFKHSNINKIENDIKDDIKNSGNNHPNEYTPRHSAGNDMDAMTEQYFDDSGYSDNVDNVDTEVDDPMAQELLDYYDSY